MRSHDCPSDDSGEGWLRLAAAGVSARDAARRMGCSLGTAAKRLSRANAQLDRPMAARLADGSFEAACSECRLTVVSVAAVATRAQADMAPDMLKRMPQERLAVPREGLMQRLYNRPPVDGARTAEGLLLKRAA